MKTVKKNFWPIFFSLFIGLMIGALITGQAFGVRSHTPGTGMFDPASPGAIGGDTPDDATFNDVAVDTISPDGTNIGMSVTDNVDAVLIGNKTPVASLTAVTVATAALNHADIDTDTAVAVSRSV